jgi:small subunit ribosomal protein S8
MINDLVADMLTRIRNASLIKHSYVIVNFNKFVLNILKVLKLEGYINNILLINTKTKKELKIFLKYKGWWPKLPVILKIKKISKIQQKIYYDYKKLYKLKKNSGIIVLSTSLGVMSHYKAIQLKIGGELICSIN